MNENNALSVRTEPAVRCLVAMIDIRGFSAFAQAENDPAAVADYVSAATKHILTRVSNCRKLADSVIKPLGDGLLFILKLDDATQATMAASTELMLNELVDVSETFLAYLSLNRPAGLSAAPSRLGIGVAFGPLVRLSVRSSKPTLEFEDYVGHTINLASRLQALARNGGCVVHEGVYEKILKHDPRTSANFISLFGQRVEVRIPNIGRADDYAVYTTAKIPHDYLKSKVDEKILEEFAQKAQAELRATYLQKRQKESHLVQLPEATRFILFKLDADGVAFRETMPFMVGQRVTFKTEASVRLAGISLGRSPVTDAIVSRNPVVVSYSCRYDECDETDPNNEYWRQTRERFPEANIEALRKFAMHPASMLAIPLLEPRSDTVSSVAVFDSSETGVFNEAIAEEMMVKLRLLYGQLFGSQEINTGGVLEF